MPIWKPKLEKNDRFDISDICWIHPSSDTLYFNVTSQSSERNVLVSITTSEAEIFANYILKAVAKTREIQEARRKLYNARKENTI